MRMFLLKDSAWDCYSAITVVVVKKLVHSLHLRKGGKLMSRLQEFFLPFFSKRFEQALPYSAFVSRYKYTRTKFPI